MANLHENGNVRRFFQLYILFKIIQEYADSYKNNSLMHGHCEKYVVQFEINCHIQISNTKTVLSKIGKYQNYN